MSLACRNVCVLGCAAILAATLANAQSATNSSADSTSNFGWSSSQSGPLQIAEGSVPASPAASPASPGPAAQDDNNTYSGWRGSDLKNRLTFEAGGGFNAPIGNDTPFITWGGNFTLGAGVRFSNRISALLEYQFMDDKLPGAFLAAYGVQAGDSHINSITGSPVIDLTPKRSNGAYVVGGWGYYHKSTNLQDYEEEESFYGIYDVPVTVASVTSNQWGGNAGLGIYHRFGGMYGDSKTQVFAEARYTFIHTPPATQPNGFGTTELLPVTLGVRF